jgi:hypothetical protein
VIYICDWLGRNLLKLVACCDGPSDFARYQQIQSIASHLTTMGAGDVAKWSSSSQLTGKEQADEAAPPPCDETVPDQSSLADLVVLL